MAKLTVPGAGGLALVLVLVVGACASSPVIKIAQRALEDRGTSDTVKDNEIVVDVNELMATYETVAVATEIYEQRLLVYGLLGDAAKIESFRGDVGKIEGVKALYWHVTYMSEADQEAKADEILGFAGSTEAQAKVEANWLSADGVSSLNIRAGIDPLATAYILGRAKSASEKQTALAEVGKVSAILRVVDYVEVRP
jgi:hyperosmotically inducible protein